MAAVLPLLSVDGFVTNKNELMTKLYEHFRASDKSQSTFYTGEVVSLKYILQQYVSETDIKKAMEDSLLKLYSNYFVTVDTYVVVDSTDNSINISVDISTIDSEGISYKFSNSVELVKNNVGTFDNLQESIRLQ